MPSLGFKFAPYIFAFTWKYASHNNPFYGRARISAEQFSEPANTFPCEILMLQDAHSLLRESAANSRWKLIREASRFADLKISLANSRRQDHQKRVLAESSIPFTHCPIVRSSWPYLRASNAVNFSYKCAYSQIKFLDCSHHHPMTWSKILCQPLFSKAVHDCLCGRPVSRWICAARMQEAFPTLIWRAPKTGYTDQQKTMGNPVF